MKKREKIYIVLIVLLIVILFILGHSYFKVRKAAQDNLNYFFEATNQVHELEMYIHESGINNEV